MLIYKWNGKKDLSKETIEGDFIVLDYVSNLKGCPRAVKGDFICVGNHIINDLSGVTDFIDGNFIFSYSDSLYQIDNLPTMLMGGNVILRNNKNLMIINLSKRILEGDFDISNCEKLCCISQCPERIKGSFYCKNNPKITDLIGVSVDVGRTFDVSYCKNLKHLSFEKISCSKFKADFCNIKELGKMPFATEISLIGNPIENVTDDFYNTIKFTKVLYLDLNSFNKIKNKIRAIIKKEKRINDGKIEAVKLFLK